MLALRDSLKDPIAWPRRSFVEVQDSTEFDDHGPERVFCKVSYRLPRKLRHVSLGSFHQTLMPFSRGDSLSSPGLSKRSRTQNYRKARNFNLDLGGEEEWLQISDEATKA